MAASAFYHKTPEIGFEEKDTNDLLSQQTKSIPDEFVFQSGLKNVLMVNPYEFTSKKNVVRNPYTRGTLFTSNYKIEFSPVQKFNNATTNHLITNSTYNPQTMIMHSNVLDVFQVNRQYKIEKSLTELYKKHQLQFIKRIQIVTKDFNTMFLSFEHYQIKSDRKFCMTILKNLLHYIFPVAVKDVQPINYGRYFTEYTMRNLYESCLPFIDDSLTSTKYNISLSNEQLETIQESTESFSKFYNELTPAPKLSMHEVNRDYVKAINVLRTPSSKIETDIICKIKEPFRNICPVPLYINKTDWINFLMRLRAAEFFEIHEHCDKSNIEVIVKQFFIVPKKLFVPNGRGVTEHTLNAIINSLKHSISKDENLPQIVFYDHKSNSTELCGGLIRSGVCSTDVETIWSQALYEMNHRKDFLEIKRLADKKNNNNTSLLSLEKITASFQIIQKLCFPYRKRYKSEDASFNSTIDKSKWLLIVHECLLLAKNIAKLISSGQWVWIQEDNPVDFVLLISCLVQILMDPYSRSRKGFEELIQREFVIGGHPFTDRMCYIRHTNQERQIQPTFLLLLDCLSQLIKFQPQYYEITQFYLITLWEVACSGLTSTFICNTQKERETLCVAPPAWIWRHNTQLFSSPSYVAFHCFADQYKSPADVLDIPPTVELWTECYFRFVSFLALDNGGYVKRLIEEARLVQSLRNELRIEKSEYLNDSIEPKDYSVIELIENHNGIISSAFPYVVTRCIEVDDDDDDTKSRDDDISLGTDSLMTRI